jgi:hypothetical protein
MENEIANEFNDFDLQKSQTKIQTVNTEYELNFDQYEHP